MPTTVAASSYVIGPASIYYRDVGVNTPWTDMGATLDDAVMRIVSEWFVPDNLSGVKGPVMGLDILRRLNAEFEFTLPDFSGNKFEQFMPGSRVTAEDHTDTTGTPGNSTLSSATTIGATTVTVAAPTNFAVGDYMRIGSGAGVLVEYRQITAIATNDLSFRDPLISAHASAEEVVETDSDYRSLIQASIYTRMPDAAYKEWAIVMANGNGYHELRLPRALSQADTSEVTIGDNALSGVRCMLSGRYDGTDLQTSPFDLYINES